MRWISVEYVLELQRQRAEINKIPLKNIVWTKGGKDLHISEKIIEDFTFTRLNNTDFIQSEFYKEGFTNND